MLVYVQPFEAWIRWTVDRLLPQSDNCASEWAALKDDDWDVEVHGLLNICVALMVVSDQH